MAKQKLFSNLSATVQDIFNVKKFAKATVDMDMADNVARRSIVKGQQDAIKEGTEEALKKAGITNMDADDLKSLKEKNIKELDDLAREHKKLSGLANNENTETLDILKERGILQNTTDFLSGADVVGDTRRRYGTAVARTLGAGMAVGTGARILTGNGGLTKNNRGDVDIAGVPFI